MIRPRTGSFVYGHAEVDTMLHEIAGFRDLGVRGVVLGCLTEDGKVDVPVTRRYGRQLLFR